MRPVRVSRRRTTTRNADAAAAATAIVAGLPVPAPSLAVFDFIPLSEAKPQRRKPGTARRPKALTQQVVFSTGRQAHQKFVQGPNLPLSSAPGVSALAQLLAGPSASAKRLEIDDDTLAFITPAGFDPDDDDVLFPARDRERHRLRRLAQHETWRDIVLPSLVRPFMAFLQGRSIAPRSQLCTCSGRRRCNILLAEWDSTSTSSWQSCRCQPLAEQLVAAGYFPCAPKRPSVAFNIRLLELISLHSLHVAPNTTAWASTLEAFWTGRGFSVQDARAFRRHLGNALQWYQVLVNRKDNVVASAISGYRRVSGLGKRTRPVQEMGDTRHRKRVRFADDLSSDAEDVNSSAPLVSAIDEQHPGNAQLPHNEQGSSSGNGSESDPGGRARPSEYLRRRCHLCFGGPRPNLQSTTAHAIVCIDANFSQKRRKSKYCDPSLDFEDGHFISTAEVDEMEREVDSKRKRPARPRTRSTSAALPDDVLDECEASFLAAQEKVTKASKNYYSDTGLMAILCRHDNVLYVVNMTSPGERQHYALALLRKLFAALPADWNIGLLYDIACQLSRSMEKFNLLGDVLDRLSFAVSVFHAYGHQWACQLVFHPRKRPGFGLSDGEGCERFWSAIRSLIPCLRVSGYYRRLFILDRQIAHIQDQNVFKFGRWLARKCRETARRLAEAERRLEACGVEERELRAQWKAQISCQLQPKPRQSQYAGDQALNKILLDLALVDELQDQLRQDRAKLRRAAHSLSSREVQDLTDRIAQARAQIKATRSRVDLARSQLGTGAQRKYEELRGDAYIRTRVNARAVRVQIRMAIQAHKFVREKLERNYRRHVMQNKDHTQMRDLVNSREKNLTALVRKYNALVNHMGELLRDAKGARRRTRLPRLLDHKKLFRLDVDDDIWEEDPGLGPQDEGDLPRWQVDEPVRRGIRALLEVDRCREERERLQAEARALLSWWSEECTVLEACSRTETDDLLATEARAQRARLDALAFAWDSELALCDLGVHFSSSSAAADVPVVAVAESRASPASEGEESDDWASIESSSDGEPSQDEEDIQLCDSALAFELDSDEGDDDAGPTTPPDTQDSVLSSPPSYLRKKRAFSPSAIDLASSSDDDDNPRSAMAGEKARAAGRFSCSGADVLRMASQTRWLSGSGLAVFAESHFHAAKDSEVGHLPSTLFVDVHEYREACRLRDETKKKANQDWIWAKIQNLPDPSTAKKWLIVAHIPSPPHWTLVEVRWKARELRFYDSMAVNGGYDKQVKALSLTLLELCESYYDCQLNVSTWRWIGEQRGVRQTNWYNCGPFIAADFVSLLRSDEPSTMKQDDMPAWRSSMAAHMRQLDEYKPQRGSLTKKQLEEAIIISD